MNNTWAGFDLRAIAQAVKENVRQFGGFNPAEVKKAGALGAEKLRGQILSALDSAELTGFEIINSIAESGPKPSGSAVYPLLEQLTDEGLLKASIKKDRKVYSLTETGKLAQATWVPAEESAETPTGWPMPNWVDLRGEVPKALARLGRLSVEVAKHGTKAQQEEAAKAIEETIKKLHQILAAE